MNYSIVEKVSVFPANEGTSDISEALKTLSYQQETGKIGRKRRQAIPLGGDMLPVVSDLHGSQHCHGVFLRWKRPEVPVR